MSWWFALRSWPTCVFLKSSRTCTQPKSVANSRKRDKISMNVSNFEEGVNVWHNFGFWIFQQVYQVWTDLSKFVFFCGFLKNLSHVDKFWQESQFWRQFSSLTHVCQTQLWQKKDVLTHLQAKWSIRLRVCTIVVTVTATSTMTTYFPILSFHVPCRFCVHVCLYVCVFVFMCCDKHIQPYTMCTQVEHVCTKYTKHTKHKTIHKHINIYKI